MWTNKPPLNLQKQVYKNQEDIETLQTEVTAIEVPQLTAPNHVTYNTSTGADISYDNGTKLRLPVKPGSGISIDATNDAQALEIKVGDTVKIPSDSGFGIQIDDVNDSQFIYFDAINSTMNLPGDGTTWITINDESDSTHSNNVCGPEITIYGGSAIGSAGDVTQWVEVCPIYNFPSSTPTTASNGTLPDDTSWTYLKSNSERIKLFFNKEYYQPADQQHTTGTLVFSHVGYENTQLIIKTITITISTRGWVLTTVKPPAYMAVSNTSIYSDTDKTDLIGTLILNIPCTYSGDIDTYIVGVSNMSYIMCAGYVTVGGVKYPVLYADQYDPETGTIYLYTTHDLNGTAYYIDSIQPDFQDLPL